MLYKKLDDSALRVIPNGAKWCFVLKDGGFPLKTELYEYKDFEWFKLDPDSCDKHGNIIPVKSDLPAKENYEYYAQVPDDDSESLEYQMVKKLKESWEKARRSRAVQAKIKEYQHNQNFQDLAALTQEIALFQNYKNQFRDFGVYFQSMESINLLLNTEYIATDGGEFPSEITEGQEVIDIDVIMVSDNKKVVDARLSKSMDSLKLSPEIVRQYRRRDGEWYLKSLSGTYKKAKLPNIHCVKGYRKYYDKSFKVNNQTRISDVGEFSELIRRLSTQALTISSSDHIMGLFKDNNYFVLIDGNQIIRTTNPDVIFEYVKIYCPTNQEGSILYTAYELYNDSTNYQSILPSTENYSANKYFFRSYFNSNNLSYCHPLSSSLGLGDMDILELRKLFKTRSSIVDFCLSRASKNKVIELFKVCGDGLDPTLALTYVLFKCPGMFDETVKYFKEKNKLVSMEDIFKMAVQINGLALQYAPEDLQNNKEIVMAAVKDNGMALEYSSKALKSNPEVVETAVKENGMALQHVPTTISSKWFQFSPCYNDMVLAALTKDVHALQFVSNELTNNPNFMEQAIQKEPLALQYASERLRDNSKLVEHAIEKDPLALQYASEKLRDNSQLVKQAIEKDPLALKYASERLRDNSQLVKQAIEKDPLALQYASGRLRDDRDVVNMAVEKNYMALKYASKTLRSNVQFVLCAMEENREAIKYGIFTTPGHEYILESLANSKQQPKNS